MGHVVKWTEKYNTNTPEVLCVSTTFKITLVHTEKGKQLNLDLGKCCQGVKWKGKNVIKM